MPLWAVPPSSGAFFWCSGRRWSPVRQRRALAHARASGRVIEAIMVALVTPVITGEKRADRKGADIVVQPLVNRRLALTVR
jgi:hypothetical protein